MQHTRRVEYARWVVGVIGVYVGNDGEAVKSILPFIADHYIGTSVQTFLDENGDQAIANYGVFQLNPEGSEFVQIGSYDGSTNEVTFSE